MASSVLLRGLPRDVPIKVLAYHLDKFLDTDEIGTFKVKELGPKSTTKWQVVINFKSSYDAFTAQSILQGFMYIWNDGEEYVLKAKVSDDPSLQSSGWQKLATETWGQASSTSFVPNISHEDARSCNDMLDIKLDLLKKQKLLLQTEREVIEAKRKLEQEYRKRHLSESDDEEVTKHRPCKHKRAKITDGSKRESYSDDSGPKRRSKSPSSSASRPRSRSRAVSRSVIRELSPNHSRSRAVSRSIVWEISPNDTSSPPDRGKGLVIYTTPVHTRLGRRNTSPDCDDSYGRLRSKYSRPPRPSSPDLLSYDHSSPRDYYDLYRRPGTPDSIVYGRTKSPDSRRRSQETSGSSRRPRSRHSRSPEHSRSFWKSKDYDAYESPDRYYIGHERDKGRRYNDAGGSKDTNTKLIDVTISLKIKRSKNSASYPVTSTDTVPGTESPKAIDERVVIKQETEYDNDNKDKDFKLQINIAIREIMTTLQSLLDNNLCVRETEKRSVMKTLKSILARRLRFLSLDQSMISNDIVNVYRYTHSEKDDSDLIKKLIEQSDQKIVIEDSDTTVPPDADNKMWSMIDEVLKDLKIDYFSDDDDDSQTVIIDKLKDEIVDCDYLNIESYMDDIKTERIDEDIKPNIQDLMKATNQEAEIVEIPKKKKKKHGPRNKVYETKDLSEKTIPAHPKFVLTVKNVLKKMKPYIYKLRGDMNVIRILDITTYEIRKKIKKLVKGKPYMKSSQITALYRERYPKDKDLKFVRNIIEKLKKGLYRDLVKKLKADGVDSDNSDNEFQETLQSTVEGNDDVIIVEKKKNIMVVEDEDKHQRSGPKLSNACTMVTVQ